MKKLLIIWLLLNVFSSIYAQINKNGVPFIKNFSTEDYNGSEQNWAVCIDNRGVVYFGNNEVGVLEFDGSNWNQIGIPNNSIVRSLAVDSLGTIYVGAVGEFGFLAPNVNGKMEFKSLYKKDWDTFGVGDVWKTYTHGNNVYYCAGVNIFKFRNKEFEKHFKDTSGGFISFINKEKLFIGNYFHGLKEIDEDNNTVLLAKGGSFYKEKDLFVFLPYSDDEVFVGTMVQGCYIYNIKTGESKDISTINNKFKKLSEFLIGAQLYNGTQLKNGNYALTTINNGCIIINREGEILYHFNKKSGLGDNTITSAFESKDGVLWLSLFNSLSYIELNSPFRKFDYDYVGIEGMIMDVERFNNTLYIGTTVGLYYQFFDQDGHPHFEMVNDINQMVWTLEKIICKNNEKKLLAGCAANVFEIINPNKVIEIREDKELVNSSFLYQSRFNKNIIYIGYRDDLSWIELKNGKWEGKEKFRISEQIESITEDKEGNLWLATLLNGIIKYNISDGSKTYFGIKDGLPFLNINEVYNIDNEIVIATKNGIYYYNRENNKIEKYNKFGEKYYNRNDKVGGLYKENDSTYWIYSKNLQEDYEYVERIIKTKDGVKFVEIPFRRLRKFTFHNISFDDHSVWLSTAGAAINYDAENKKEFKDFYNSLVRKVSIQLDSVTFWGTNYSDTVKMRITLEQPENIKYTFDYKHNSINFNFSSPYYPVEETKYSYKLEGFENNWSRWDIKTEKGYTNLNEGKYTFKVKAKNIYGIESEIATYEFTIKPPWYRTIWAYILYFILAIFVVVVIVKVYTRRLELEKIRLEQIVKERTEEVVKQKEEIEKQRDTIAEKNKSITDSIEYAKRIQTAILPSETYAAEILPEHFIFFRPRDIVSGDFYWMTQKDNLLVLIAADCTGHGVPGAFMSMLGVSFLNEIVNRHEITTANIILNDLRADVKKTLGQEGKEGEAKDGMDLALCIVDLEKMKLQYAGAYNPMYLYRNNELIEVKADRMPIGIFVKEKESFTNNELDLQKGDVFYIFSDGYQDQFGGEDGQKFKTKNFKKLLLDIYEKPMAEQREILNTRIDEWRGKWEQVDDIIVLGVRV